MKELAYVNGVFGPIQDATVSIEDRGFQFGDGIYEVVMTYDRRPFLLQEHLDRLRRSADAIGLTVDSIADSLPSVIAEGLTQSGAVDALVYIQITRGVASRNHIYPGDMQPTVVLTFKERPTLADSLRDDGVKVITVEENRWANCFIKAITLLPNILAKNEAIRRGFSDALFVTKAGEVRELTAANVFVVVNGEILIPPRTDAILHGVTQGFVIECAKALGLQTTERAFDVETMLHADEVFLSSSTTEVLAITQVNEGIIADGRPGPIARQLYEEFITRVRGCDQPGSGDAKSGNPKSGKCGTDPCRASV